VQVTASRNLISAKIFGRARLLLTFMSAGFTPFVASAQAGDVAPPKLVVFITVDAMRADYLPRFAQQLTGGLGRLYPWWRGIHKRVSGSSDNGNSSRTLGDDVGEISGSHRHIREFSLRERYRGAATFRISVDGRADVGVCVGGRECTGIGRRTADGRAGSLAVDDRRETLAPYNYWFSGPSAQHGSPNDSDARMPIIFFGSGVRPGRYDEFARVVDMAPTLAAIVRVTPLEKLDGHVMQNATR
jgi:hypothetical protein